MGWIKFNNKTLADVYVEGMPVYERTDSYVVQPNECIKTYDFIEQGEDGFWRYIRGEATPINQTELPDVTTDPDTWDWVEVTDHEEAFPFHFTVEHFPDYHMPEREYTVTHVPGRNGDALYDVGSYKNVTLEYEVAIVDPHNEHTFVEMSRLLSAWLHQGSGYLRLEDSYHPDEYRMAYYKEDGSITNILDQAGRITLKFVAKPQRYLTSGDTWLDAVVLKAKDNEGVVSATRPLVAQNQINAASYSTKPILRISLYPGLVDNDETLMNSFELNMGVGDDSSVPNMFTCLWTITGTRIYRLTTRDHPIVVLEYDFDATAGLKLVAAYKRADTVSPLVPIDVPENTLIVSSNNKFGFAPMIFTQNDLSKYGLIRARCMATTEDEGGKYYFEDGEEPLTICAIEVKPRWWIL